MIPLNTQHGDASQVAGAAAEGDLKTRPQRWVDNYVWDANPQVRERLEWFMDQKLGLMVHYGIYNELGIKESWPLIDFSAYGSNPYWTRRQFPKDWEGKKIKEEYYQLHRGFNPRFFDPEQWAAFAERTGFKYLLLRYAPLRAVFPGRLSISQEAEYLLRVQTVCRNRKGAGAVGV